MVLDKKTACHELADLNERVFDLEKSLEKIMILIATCKPNEKQVLQNRKIGIEKDLAIAIKNKEKFLKKFYDIIHS